jgi:hypothetical protein
MPRDLVVGYVEGSLCPLLSGRDRFASSLQRATRVWRQGRRAKPPFAKVIAVPDIGLLVSLERLLRPPDPTSPESDLPLGPFSAARFSAPEPNHQPREAERRMKR